MITKHGTRKLVILLIAFGPVLTIVAGCTSRKEQLHGLARDWFETIRAEQVIPILPLTSDLQPGDVFLVQTTIDKQQHAWRRGDYLPLDNHIHRLHPTAYADFYARSFFDPDDPATLPKDWIQEEWSNAPAAAFPTFTFETTSSGGFNSLIPVQGVPVGMSLLGAQRANGTIVLDDARTIGVAMLPLYGQVKAWAEQEREALSAFAPGPDGVVRNYLRVVSRVYLTGKVSVTIQDSRRFASGTDVGIPRPVELALPTALPPAGSTPGATPAERVAEFNAGIKAMNAMLSASPETVTIDGVTQVLPGASVRVTTASARTISLDETFDAPLVVGYLGFDVPVLAGGRIGDQWIPTHALLDGVLQPASYRVGATLPPDFARRITLLETIEARDDADAVFQAAAQIVGPDFAAAYSAMSEADSLEPADRFATLALVLQSERKDLQTTVKRINDALAEALAMPENNM